MWRLIRHLGHYLGRYDSSKQGSSIVDLPEELIIFHIMSRLDLRDIMNFSMVQKQWEHIPSCLDSTIFDKYMTKNGDEWALVNSVYQFMRHYISLRRKFALPIIPIYFCFSFFLNKHYFTQMDSWIQVAFRFGVTTLYIDLRGGLSLTRPDSDKYIFPWNSIHWFPSMLRELYLISCIFGCSLTSKWKHLEILCMYDTPVTEYDMDRIVHCFPKLWKLEFCSCSVPAKLTFATDSLAILKLKMCTGLEEVDLLNTRALKKFTYHGSLVPQLISVPRLISPPGLTNLKVSIFNADLETYVFQNLRRDFPEMRTLSILRFCDTLPPLSRFRGQMSSLLLLEVLKLQNHPASCFSLETMTEILKACPVLRRLEIIPPCTLDARISDNSQVQYVHNYLSDIKITGFCGSQGNVELAKFLVQVSEILDHVVVQRKIEAKRYWFKKHSAKWHGEQEPKFVKDLLLKLTKSKRLTFL